MPEFTYIAERTLRTNLAPYVWVSKDAGEPLLLTPDRSRKVFAHSKHLDWGYLGGRAAQLALAILLHETSPDEAERRHQDFMREVISCIKGDSWEMTTSAVQEWLCNDRGNHPLPEGIECSS